MSNKPTLDKLIVWYQHALTDPAQEESPSRILKQQLTQLIADIIGEDLKDVPGAADWARDGISGSNAQKVIQRERAKERGIDL